MEPKLYISLLVHPTAHKHSAPVTDAYEERGEFRGWSFEASVSFGN